MGFARLFGKRFLNSWENHTIWVWTNLNPQGTKHTILYISQNIIVMKKLARQKSYRIMCVNIIIL